MAINSAKAKDFDFTDIVSVWKGYVSSVDRTNIKENYLVRGSQNVYKKLSGNISVRPGQKRRGAANATNSPVSSEFVWNTSWGATYTLVIADSNLYVVINDIWYSLLSGLTATRYVFDKWWNNTEQKDRVLFVNGSSDIFGWSGGYATIASVGTNTLTKQGTTSWQQAGFSVTSGEKKIMIAGVEYTYTGGETTTTLTGVTPDPAVASPAIAVGAVALQSVITTSNKPAAGFSNDIIKVINNQVYVASYTSRLVYISKNTDFTDYTVPTPRLAGDPEILTLDGTVKGIGVRQGKAHIGFGSGSWAVVSFNDITVGADLTQQTVVDVKPVALLQAPYAHEFIDSVGDNLIYLAQDNQVRSFGDFNTLFVSGYPSLSQEIAKELTEENFEGGCLRTIGEFVYVTAPTSGKTYLYQVRSAVDANGSIIAERLWHSPFIWNATRIDQIDGDVVVFSNANPQIYSVWNTGQWHDDSPSDENLPYSCIMALGYRGGTRRQGLWSFDKLFVEGYLSEGTPLNLIVNYNYQGAANSIMTPINSTEYPAYLFNQIYTSMGDNSLGDEPFGNGGVADPGFDQDSLPKFKTIKSLTIVNCFEWQPIFYSDKADAQWEILATGTNAREETEQNATFIINKNRA